MNITYFTIVMALLWSGFFFLFFNFLRKTGKLICVCSITGIIILYLICIIRMFLPVEFTWTVMIPGGTVLNFFNGLMRREINILGLKPSVSEMILVIWGMVALVFICIYLIRYFKLSRFIKVLPIERDERIKSVLLEVSKSKKIYEIRRTEILSVPCCFGIFRKYIILPDIDYSEETLRYILLHESMHLKCNDSGIKLLTNLLCSIYWWNPLVYLLRKDLNQSMEIRCDQMVVRQMGMSSREKYLKILLDEYRNAGAENISERNNMLVSSLLEKHTEPLIERFEQLRKKNIKSGAFGLILTVIFGIATLMASYSFTLQSSYECPMEEIETEEGIYKLDVTDMYVIEQPDGTYSLYTGMTFQSIDSEKLDILIQSGVKVYKK